MSCTNAPSFDVEYIDFNYTGTHIFVAGRRGISVVLLPHTFAQSRKVDDGEHTLARCVCSMFYHLWYALIRVVK